MFKKPMFSKIDVLFFLFVAGTAGTIWIVMTVVPAIMHSAWH